MSITHIVLLQFKPGADPAAVKTTCLNLLALATACVHPTTQTPYIRRVTGGHDNSPEGLQHGATHGFVVEFASAADRDYYVQSDPAHLAFVASLKGLAEKITVVDFTPSVF
ncbi:Stress responsive alpha-beta barrel [Niveomyces insectorum RCEF 264]|uniref:Stress responsive alpha-beta barrel n=1 Tax=Niveomyces insectorum RCEF 264 TaxID=1081102 RepID=A0A162JC80_9HYPO|nr:Stress responsive alpha-beta barrel [Niveomyces insectorum RCEF 264]